MSIQELRFLIDAISYCDSETRCHSLLKLTEEIILDVEDKNNAELIWLKTRFPLFDKNIHESDIQKLLSHALLQASDGGCKEAQYEYGCMLYEQGNRQGANQLYEASANQGYPPAQWVFGYQLLKSNFDKGCMYITLSASQNYEYAIDFLIDSYSNGKNGFDVDIDELQKWNFVKSYNLD